MIDGGSTHNFIAPLIICKANIPIQSDLVFKIHVANGERLKGNGVSKGAVIHSRGVPIQADFYLPSLGGIDGMLGVHCLRSLGPFPYNVIYIKWERIPIEGNLSL